MKRTRVLIIEDELIIAEKTKKILSEIGYEVCSIATSFEEGLAEFAQCGPDILIVDINLNGEKDGLDLLIELRKKESFKAIVITSYSDQKTVEKAKKAKPDAYLVKPFGKEDLYTTIEILTSEKDEETFNTSGDQIFVKSNNAVVKIDLKDVIAVRSEDIYCAFMMEDGKEHLVRNSMKQLLNKLGSDFLRIHKSYLVRFERIDKMEYDGVYVGELKLPIGRTYREELMKRLNPL